MGFKDQFIFEFLNGINVVLDKSAKECAGVFEFSLFGPSYFEKGNTFL